LFWHRQTRDIVIKHTHTHKQTNSAKRVETPEEREERRRDAESSFRHWLERKAEAERARRAELRRAEAARAEADMDREGGARGSAAHKEWCRRKAEKQRCVWC
jgi:hypothetical protein